MLKSDLKQIKQIVDTSINKSIKENNKKIFKKIDDSAESIAINTNESFDELEGKMNKRFDGIDERFDGVDDRLDGIDKSLDGIDKRLEQKADRNTLLNWADDRILELELDRNKVKYFHPVR